MGDVVRGLSAFFLICSTQTGAYPECHIPVNLCNYTYDTVNPGYIELTCRMDDISKLYVRGYKNHVSNLTLYLTRVKRLPSRAFRFGGLFTLYVDGGKQLKALNRNVFGGLERSLVHLTLKNTLIEQIPVSQISQLGNLRTLCLEESEINLLSANLLSVPLRYLSFRDNHIEDVQGGILPSTLETLDLSNNLIASLSGMLKGNFSTLSTLIISYNSIDEIHGELQNTPNLEYLYAKDNYIEDVDNDSFTSVPLLKHLDLSWNWIASVKGGLLHLSLLESLSLEHNRLSEIKTSAFGRLTSLKSLILSKNNISNIEESTFDCMNSLDFLDIGDNNLVNLNFLIPPARNVSPDTGRDVCIFKNYETELYLDIAGNGLTCKDVWDVLLFLENKEAIVVGSPCELESFE